MKELCFEFKRLIVAAITCLAMSLPSVVLGESIQVLTDETWTEAKQADISASDGIEIAAGATLTLDVAGTLSMTKPISGAGSLVQKGAGSVRYEAQSAFTGSYSLESGTAYLCATDCIGCGDASFSGAVNVENTITLGNSSVAFNYGGGYGAWAVEMTGECTISGSTTFNVSGSIWMHGSGTLIFEKPVVTTATAQYCLIWACGLEFRDIADLKPGGTFYVEASARVTFRKGGNVWAGNSSFTFGKVDLYATNAIPAAASIHDGDQTWTYDSYINLHGCDQTFDRLYSTSTTQDTANQRYATLKTDEGTTATVTMKGTASGSYCGRVGGGAVNVVWSPIGDYTFVFSGYSALSSSQTGGKLRVERGRMEVRGGASFPNVSAVEVAGGTFYVAADGAVNQSLPRLEIASGAKFETESKLLFEVDAFACGERVGKPNEVFTGDEGLGHGSVYIPELGANTTVRVKPRSGEKTEADWTGDGGSASVDDAANWGGTMPDLTDFGTVATFAQKGTEAIFSKDAQFGGIVFDSPAPGFTLKGGDLDVSTADGGIVALSSDGADRRYAVEPGVVVADAQTWDVGAKTTFSVLGGVHSVLPFPLVKTGAGVLRLSGEGSFTGPFDFSSGAVCFDNPAAFGSSDERVYLNASVDGVYASFGTGTFSRKLAINTSGGWPNAYNVKIDENAHVTFAKKVYRTEGTDLIRCQMGANSEMVFAGGLDVGIFTVDTAGSRVVISNVPAHFQMWCVSYDQLHLKVGGNVVDDNSQLSGASQLHIEADDVFAAPFSLNSAQAWQNTLIDLHGHDVEFKSILTADADGGNARVRSDTAATLTLDGPYSGSALTDSLIFEGGASLRWKGPSGVTYTLLRSCTSTGGVEVASGTLALAASAVWGSSSYVKVSGSQENPGTLVVSDRSVLPGKGRIYEIDGEGVLNLSEGVRLQARELWMDGVKMPAGDYGATASGLGDSVRRHFAGTGVLHVRGGGFSITVR